jgi:hypothetical protein
LQGSPGSVGWEAHINQLGDRTVEGIRRGRRAAIVDSEGFINRLSSGRFASRWFGRYRLSKVAKDIVIVVVCVRRRRLIRAGFSLRGCSQTERIIIVICEQRSRVGRVGDGRSVASTSDSRGSRHREM